MFIPIEEVTSDKLKNTTLIMPALSIGQLGSMALNIFIQNNQCIKIGYYNSKNLQKVVQISEDINKKMVISVSAELYQFQNYTLLQLNSTIKDGRKKQFLVELNAFIKQNYFKETILLSSIPQSMLPDYSTYLYFSSFDLRDTQYSIQELIHVKDYQPNSVYQNVEELMESSGLSGIFNKNKQFKNFKHISLICLSTSAPDIRTIMNLLNRLISFLGNSQIKQLEYKFEKEKLQSNYAVPSHILNR